MAANRGLCEYEVLRDGKNTLAVTLLRCIGEVGDWGVFPTPLGQKKGTFTLEYALIPYVQSQRDDAYSLGYTFAGSAVSALQTEKHSGILPMERSFVRFDQEHIRISAFKKAEDSDHLILRLFNTAEEEICLSMTVPAFGSAALTDLNERRTADLAVDNGTIVLRVPAKKIMTVELW